MTSSSNVYIYFSFDLAQLNLLLHQSCATQVPAQQVKVAVEQETILHRAEGISGISYSSYTVHLLCLVYSWNMLQRMVWISVVEKEYMQRRGHIHTSHANFAVTTDFHGAVDNIFNGSFLRT